MCDDVKTKLYLSFVWKIDQKQSEVRKNLRVC